MPGEIAIVTGAGTGLGRACALRFGRRDLSVFCVGRRAEPLKETVRAIEQEGGRGRAIAADVGTDEGIEAVGDEVGEGNVRAIVHAAARESVIDVAGTDRAELEAVLETNTIGPFLMTRALLPRLVDGASIVFIASSAAAVGSVRHTAYGTSKAALLGMTRHLAAELAPTVRVNCVSPGGMDTPLAQVYLQSFLGDPPSEGAMALLQADAARVLLRRLADPDEVAATVEHVSLDATAMTGAIVPVDLGYTAR